MEGRQSGWSTGRAREVPCACLPAPFCSLHTPPGTLCPHTSPPPPPPPPQRIEDPIGLLPPKLILGINKRGVHFFRPVPKEYLHSAELRDIMQFGSSSQVGGWARFRGHGRWAGRWGGGGACREQHSLQAVPPQQWCLC